MVLFFTVTLLVSVAGMILLIAIKRFEVASGRIMLSGVRPRLNSFFARLSWWGNKMLPALARQQVERIARLALARTQLAIAHAVVYVEHLLERVLNAVRSRTEGQYMEQEPSAFLREVADHKKTLLHKKRSSKKQTPQP